MPIDLFCVMERKQGLVARQQSTPYQKQKSALEMEFKKFLESASPRDMCTAIPDDVVDFLICKTALQTFLPLSVMQTHPYVCPVTAVEVYISLCGLLKILSGQGFLFRPLNPSGEVIQVSFESATTQA